MEQTVRRFVSFKKVDRLDTLILGSSHGLYGYLATNGEFNFCNISQDLYYSYHLLKKYSILNELRKVVCFYSVFSPGAELEKTREYWRCAPYFILEGIPYRYKAQTELAYAESVVKDCLRKVVDQEDLLGNIDHRWFMSSSADLQSRVAGHVKNNLRGTNQTRYIEAMLDLSADSSWEFVVVIPPVTIRYLSYLPDSFEPYEELMNLRQRRPELKIINFHQSPLFEDSDFGDADHLNEVGALKLSRLIREL